MGVKFKPGNCANPNGRPKGSKTKLRYEVLAALQELNFDPFKKLVDLALNARSERVQCDAASELAQYIAPKLKAVEISADRDSPVQFTINIPAGVENCQQN